MSSSDRENYSFDKNKKDFDKNKKDYHKTMENLEKSPETLIEELSKYGINEVNTLEEIKEGSRFGVVTLSDAEWVIDPTWNQKSDKILQNVLANFEHFVSSYGDENFDKLKSIFKTEEQQKKLDKEFQEHFQKVVPAPPSPLDRREEQKEVPSPRVGRMFESPPPSPREDQPTIPPGGMKNIK